MCCGYPKGGAAMYDYMKALQKRFDHQEHPELAEQVERAQEELRRNKWMLDLDSCGISCTQGKI